MENDLSAEELSTPVTITRGELNQLSHAFNNYQAMAEQVQSLVTQVVQLRLLSATPTNTPESSSRQQSSAPPTQVPKAFNLIHSSETGSNSTPISLAVNMFSSHNPAFFPQNNTKSSMPLLTLRATPTHGINPSFRNTPKALQYQLSLPPSKS